MDSEKGILWPPARPTARPILLALSTFSLLFIAVCNYLLPTRLTHVPAHAATTLARCAALEMTAGPSSDFYSREESDRYVPGTPATLIKNARIYTGSYNMTEVVRGDVLMDKGLIKAVGNIGRELVDSYGEDITIVDANGAWITSGIVDLHSHLGDSSSPALNGAEDDNSLKGTAQPWLRSLDGLNTHDDSYRTSIAGGVTTSLVLPGSANAIGGQAFVIKLRKTKENSPTSMLLEPPYNINGSSPPPGAPLHWRHMKHACGENPSAVYGDTRMDTMWAFRKAYNTARQIMEKQDAYCASARAGKWDTLGSFPEELQWEALVDVIRGRVKVNVHCYETVDLDDLVRLSNEFKFPIAAVHHAHEAYLVPDTLKKAYGGHPGVALFATNARYKREAYRGSEFAPAILASNGLRVVMKSDHPVLNSRFLLYEAQQAYYYGLPANMALAAVTSTSADLMGMGHRIGYIREGYDADLVIWDSHPLTLGATPKQVYIDGIQQIDEPHNVHKPKVFQEVPEVPDFSNEAKNAIKYDGLPPLEPHKELRPVIFTNVASLFATEATSFTHNDGVIVVANGTILCSGSGTACSNFATNDAQHIDLAGGSISPALVSYGSPLGLSHIDQEPSTNDGIVPDPFIKDIPKIVGGEGSTVSAVDGLLFASRDALLAYRAGVAYGITAPSHKLFYSGLGTFFSLGAMHKLEKGAVLQDVTALHVSVRHFGTPSVSTQIAALRKLLLGPKVEDGHSYFRDVATGKLTLVVEAHSADIIATLVRLKYEVERETGSRMKLTISGASEAHILAKELGEAGVGVILNPPRPFPYVWEDRRILPGPPLSESTAATTLMAHGVTVGIGIEEIWSARNLRFDLAWQALDGGLSKVDAIALASVNLEKLLGARVPKERDLVVTRGGDLLDMTSKVLGVLSSERQVTHLF